MILLVKSMSSEGFLLNTGGRQFFVTVHSQLKLSIFTQKLQVDYFLRIVKVACTTSTHASQVVPNPQISRNHSNSLFCVHCIVSQQTVFYHIKMVKKIFVMWKPVRKRDRHSVLGGDINVVFLWAVPTKCCMWKKIISIDVFTNKWCLCTDTDFAVFVSLLTVVN